MIKFKRFILATIFVILISIVLIKIGFHDSNLSGGLRLAFLFVTATIVAYYTYQTYKLREIEQERLKKENFNFQKSKNSFGFENWI